MAESSPSPRSLLFQAQTRIHNVLRRNFDSVEHNLAKLVQTSEKRENAKYLLEFAACGAWCSCFLAILPDSVFHLQTCSDKNILRSHHDAEELIWFPLVEEKARVDTAKLSEDHTALMQNLEAAERVRSTDLWGL